MKNLMLAPCKLLLLCVLTFTSVHRCNVQCKRNLIVILTENKKIDLGFDNQQSRTGNPDQKILATPMSTTNVCSLERFIA